MATQSCTIGGMRARSKDGNNNGPYWFATNHGSLGTSVDDSDAWGLINGTDFNVINPIISSTGGNNKYTVAIKITTPSLSNVTISSLTLTCRLFRHGTSTGTVYASLRTTSASSSSDTVDTWRTYSVGNEAYVGGVVASTSSPYEWTMTFSGNFSANTNYYLFLYTKSTDYIYGAYGDWDVCSNAYVTYTQNIATYTVSYRPGSYSNETTTYSATKTEGAALTLRGSTYTRTGHTQGGWSTAASGTSKSYNLSASYTSDAAITLYPYWVKDTYTVSYKPGSYSNETTTYSATKTYGTSLTLKDVVYTRTGYTQTGWASDAAGTNFVYDVSGSYTTNAAVTLYPYWTRNTYTLTIDPNSGLVINGSLMTSEDANVWSSTAFTTDFAYGVKTFIGNLTPGGNFHPSNAPKKTGYTFTEYTFSPGGSGQKNTAGETFYFMGESPEVVSGTATSTTAYIFNGDYAGNVTATANYTANTYYVQYDANGGSGTMNNSTHKYDSTSNLTANVFTYTGYVFSGWNTAADGSGTSYVDKAAISNLTTTSEGVVTLYAQWGSGTYSVSFNLKGGSSYGVDFSTMTCTVGQSYTLPTGDLYKTKYTFAGWDTSSAASTVVYGDGATITDIASAGSSITLYAVWSPKVLTLVYNSNNGQSLTSTQTCNFSNAVSYAALPTSWTREGYSAVGWGLTASKVDYLFGQSITTDMGYEDGDTVNLYCIWTERDPWTLSVINIYIPDQGGWIAF